MPAYIQSPFKPSPVLLQSGTPAYLWGSFDDRSSPTQGFVISNSATSSPNIGTLTYMTTSGNNPSVGDLITVVGTSNSSGHFNVTNAVILTGSIAMDGNGFDSGVVTVTYALGTPSSQASTGDSGQIIIPRSEVPEALTSSTASAPVAMPYNNVTFNQNQALTSVVSFPSIPTSVVVSLQQSVRDIDSEYTTIATAVTVAGGVVSGNSQITVDPTLGRFFRYSNGTVVGGSSPTIIAKLLM